ncbi:MAG: hypothetical protein UHZ06_05210 [Paludibacteraceae bacterium]|nr:hypothetical protein [Paludibacteraceae bacterium]
MDYAEPMPKIMIETNNFSASRGQSQTCLNYAEAMPEIMSEANNFAPQRLND